MQKKEKETSSRKRNVWLYGPGRQVILMLMGLWLFISLFQGLVKGHDLQMAVSEGLFVMALVLIPSLLLSFIKILPLLLMKYVKGSQKREKLRKMLVHLRIIDDDGKLDNSPRAEDLDIGFELTSSLFRMVSHFAMIFVCGITGYAIVKGCVSG